MTESWEVERNFLNESIKDDNPYIVALECGAGLLFKISASGEGE